MHLGSNMLKHHTIGLGKAAKTSFLQKRILSLEIARFVRRTKVFTSGDLISIGYNRFYKLNHSNTVSFLLKHFDCSTSFHANSWNSIIKRNAVLKLW